MKKVTHSTNSRQTSGPSTTANKSADYGAGRLQVTGKVIHGKGFGKVLGYPTANIDRRDYTRQKLNLKTGIWSGAIRYQISAKSYKLYKAAIVIEPKDSMGLPKIEAHLIGYKGNLYGRKITLIFFKFIRPFKKFKDIQTLKTQIAKDIYKIKHLVYGK